MGWLDLGYSDTLIAAGNAAVSVANFLFSLVKWIFDNGLVIGVQLATWIYAIAVFIWRNFRYDNPFHLFVLSCFLLLDVLGFIVLFGGSAAYSAGGFTDAEVGSGYIMSGFGEADYGSTFNNANTGNGAGQDPSGSNMSDDLGNNTNPENSYDYCGNNVCDNFKTLAKWAEMDVLLQGCSDYNVYYDVPLYCVKSGHLVTLPVMRGNVTEYTSALCGTSNAEQGLNTRCFLNSQTHEIWYHETRITCPHDCNDSLSCYKDLTCDRVDNCYVLGGSCCSSGSPGLAGKCTYDILSEPTLTAICWGDDTSQVLGGSRLIDELRSVPFHCECNTDSDCSGDYGGTSCCPSGTYYDGLCYNQCDIL